MPSPPKHLIPTEDVLHLLDETVTALSACAVEFAGRMDGADEELACLDQWHKLEKAARSLQQAREIENESLAAVSVVNAEKELIRRAVALLDCTRVTGGVRDPSAPDSGYPARQKRRHPWGRSPEDEWTGEET